MIFVCFAIWVIVPQKTSMEDYLRNLPIFGSFYNSMCTYNIYILG